MLTNKDIQLLRKELRKDFVTKRAFHKTTVKLLELVQGVGDLIIKELGVKIDDIGVNINSHEQRIRKIEVKLAN